LKPDNINHPTKANPDRSALFQRAMKRFLKNPSACARPGNSIIRDLIEGWGNENWSALDDYLAACIDQTLRVQGPILECGSGLTTLLISAIAGQRGQRLYTLENDPEWAARARTGAKEYNLSAVCIFLAELKDYGAFQWYTIPPRSLPKAFSLVICDGPPGRTRGGRIGLVPVMRQRFASDCVILLDDAHRENELEVAKMWSTELCAPFQVLGAGRPYIKFDLRS
jgi:hypothetical protein